MSRFIFPTFKRSSFRFSYEIYQGGAQRDAEETTLQAASS